VRAVRATMALRANVLAKGYSGIRRATLERLIDLLNRRVHPVVPSRGSVGASGDLAPLAHLALVLVGEGHATVGDDPSVRPAPRRCAAAASRP
jgi:histidine ammonia-lyase